MRATAGHQDHRRTLAALVLLALVAVLAPAAPARALGLSAPKTVTATALSQDQIRLTWTAGTGAAGYRVLRSGSSGGPYQQVASTTEREWTDEGLTAATRYWYVVVSTSGDLTSRPSREVSATTWINPPQGVRATGAPDRITLSWEPSPGATGYTVLRWNNGSYESRGDTTGTSFVDTAVTTGPEYLYRVRAVSASSSNESAEVWARVGAPSTITLTVSPARTEAGQAALLTAKVVAADPDTPTFLGGVYFYADGRALQGAWLDSSGRAEVVTSLPVGAHTVYAQFAGSQTPAVGASASAAVAHPVVPAYGQVNYGSYRTYGFGTVTPSSVAVADVTGDGRADLLMGTYTYAELPEDNCKLLVLAQRPDGTLAPPQVLATHGYPNGTVVLATGDVDADGDTDVAAIADSGVDVFVQQAGGLAAPVLLPLATRPTDLRLADLNADRRADLVVAEQDRLTVHASMDGRTFAPPVLVDDGYDRGLVDTADLDGDGRRDIVQLTNTTATLEVFTQTAEGGFARAGAYPVPDGTARGIGSMAAGDLTGDGRADVAVTAGGNKPGSRLLVFPQTGAGALGAPVAYPHYDIPQPLVLADVNGDALLDAVTAHGGWQAAGVSLQRPDGQLGRERLWGLPYASSYPGRGLAVGDLTGDGRPDLVLADYNSGLVVLPQV
ncbi:FG-GAP-like repeat-containing protein [Micromonospora sp. NPDC049836]|uniref:FG-GAP-like repeat-containing protein n=1 Tax=Micromonospora sp. NPDC049836 TaxID=3364274 RepID=UPI0037936A5C